VPKSNRRPQTRQVRHTSDAVAMILLACGSLIAWANWWPASVVSTAQGGGFIPAHAFGTSAGKIALIAAISLIGGAAFFLVPTRMRILGAAIAAIACVVLLIDAGTALSSAVRAYSRLSNANDTSGLSELEQRSVILSSILPTGGALLGGLLILFGALHLIGDGFRVVKSNRASVAQAEPVEYAPCSACGVLIRPEMPACGACGARFHQDAAHPLSSDATLSTRAPNSPAREHIDVEGRCASCGEMNGAGARFCGECGVSLAPATIEARPSVDIPPPDSSLWISPDTPVVSSARLIQDR